MKQLSSEEFYAQLQQTEKGRWNSLGDSFGNNEYINGGCKITHWHKIPRDKQLKIK